jgi:hypothetical protein
MWVILEMFGILFESSYYDKLNGSKIIFLYLILMKINVFIYITIIDHKIIFSDHISIKFIPFESFYWDELNGNKIIFLHSILTKIDMFKK